MAHYTQAAPRLRLVQSMEYRNEAEEWSNSYSFKGPAPTNDADWLALANAFITQLRNCFSARTTFVRAYGYAPNAVGANFVHDFASPGPPPAGTMVTTSKFGAPGDVAATGRLSSDKFNPSGKRVYGRSYWHDVYANSSDADRLDSEQQSLLTTFLTQYTQGLIYPGTDSCLPDLSDTHSPHVDQWLTTRTLKRRGKRKTTTTPAL
jgi:hypothetical protein